MDRTPTTIAKWLFYLALVVGTIVLYDRLRMIPSIRYSPADLKLGMNRVAGVNSNFTTRIFDALGCTRVETDDWLAGLDPAYPLAWCWKNGQAPASGGNFKSRGCAVRSYVGLAMLKEGQARFIGNTAELAGTFAPIQTAGEALSYALAATGLHISPTETHVEENSGGFAVQLYSDMEPPCGCAEHKTYAVNLLVTRQGDVKETDRQVARQLLACID